MRRRSPHSLHTRCVLALVAARGLLLDAAAAPVVRVTVHADRPVGDLHIARCYTNTSRRPAPPPALAERDVSEFGQPAITRCWLRLNDMWDSRTGEFHFNYQIGKDIFVGDTVKHGYDRRSIARTDILFHDYLDAFSRNSDEILRNVRRYSDRLHLLPWVLYHSPAQRSRVQFDLDLRLALHGAAMKMLSLHRQREVAVESATYERNRPRHRRARLERRDRIGRRAVEPQSATVYRRVGGARPAREPSHGTWCAVQLLDKGSTRSSLLPVSSFLPI